MKRNEVLAHVTVAISIENMRSKISRHKRTDVTWLLLHEVPRLASH